MPDRLPNALLSFLSATLHSNVHAVELSRVGGGSINDAFRVVINKSHTYFLKENKADHFPALFEKEKQGLEYLASQHCIAIPSVLYYGIHDNSQWLLLEWTATGIRTSSFWKKFGEQLAQLHRCSSDRFGFITDNYMGALPQSNTLTGDWTDFFLHQRIFPQTELAVQKKLLSGTHADLFQQLGKKLGTIFNQEPPSLLHGDLWSGNFMCNDQSLPVLIDPAVYYGHRSIDMAMTTLFGGFDHEFYDSYHYHFPLPANHEEQWEICNLYPLLVHLNLFGSGYLDSILSTLKRFV